MPRATRRDIEKSAADHAVDVRSPGTKRPGNRVSDYTSEGSRAVLNRVPGAFGKVEGHTGPQVKDKDDRYWTALGKQVRVGAAVRLNVRR